MEKLVNKYADKLIKAGLAHDPLICGQDEDIVWNRQDDAIATLIEVMEGMDINSLIYAEPAEPYRTILAYLASIYPECILPRDCETRTFLHDLPITRQFSADALLSRLLKRKSVLIAEDNGLHIATFGTVSPEQAFVTFSSVCFAGFVLFFSQYLEDTKKNRINMQQEAAFQRAISFLDIIETKPPETEIPETKVPVLQTGPFSNEAQVYDAITEAGKETVKYGLVDSYFGNISYLFEDIIYISQTGSSLDELAGCIDPCPLDGSSCAGITASSELVAHHEIYLRTSNRAILHGHPKFSVILSMDCDRVDCPNSGQCHIKCSEQRYINDIPIVPGEVGTGTTGLCHTLPPAMKRNRGVIVWGHGLFTVAEDDYKLAFKHLLDIENMCREEYFNRLTV